jgi:hypothetical protein
LVWRGRFVSKNTATRRPAGQACINPSLPDTG